MDLPKTLDALLITNPTNIRYLTGFTGAAPEEREAYVLVTDKETYLFTNSLYLEQANSLAGITVIQISRENPIAKEVKRICEILKVKKLGFEEENLTVAEYVRLTEQLPGVRFVATKNTIEESRQIKRADELASIKNACAVTDACFDYILMKLMPGVTEPEIAWEIQSFCRKNGATDAFSPIVAFGKNSSQPHYNTSSHGAGENQSLALKSNDIVLLDFGARVNGYCADMTRVIFVGTPKREWVYAYETVSEAHQKALDLLSSGERSGSKLDAAAKQVIAEAGLPPYSHSLGHNVGLDIHEGPRLSIAKEEELKPGMVFSVEPGVYMEGQYGIRIEDLVRLTSTGIEVLSRSPKTLTVV